MSMGSRGLHIFRLQISLLFFISNSTAKTKLAILAFLFCRELVKNSSQCVHHLSLSCCHSLRVNIPEQILPLTFQVYFTGQCLIELKHKHHAKQPVLKLSSYFNAGMSYINPASFAIPWNIPFLSSNNVEGASNSAILP